MSMSDPIADMLTRIRNAQAARRHNCSAPYSRIKKELCELLVREGFLSNVEQTGEAPKLSLKVSFVPGKILELKRVSKPGRRSQQNPSSRIRSEWSNPKSDSGPGPGRTDRASSCGNNHRTAIHFL